MRRLHAFADHAVVSLLPRLKLYKGGFGDVQQLERAVEEIAGFRREHPVTELTLRSRARQRFGEEERHSLCFESPAARRLPAEARTLHAELMLPLRGPTRGVCLVLAATGEEGFGGRRRFMRPLLRLGIGALFLENAFYGLRRPRGQLGPMLRTVSEQFAMNLTTVEEARALLGWLRTSEGFVPGVTGYSQGGMMAAFAGALVDFPVALVPRGAGDGAAPIFLDSALTHRLDWNALAKEAGSLANARSRFSGYLEPVKLSRHAAPVFPRSAIIVASRHDGFIPPKESEALHAHWAGSELRITESGHVTHVILHGKTQRRAIIDAFRRLP